MIDTCSHPKLLQGKWPSSSCLAELENGIIVPQRWALKRVFYYRKLQRQKEAELVQQERIPGSVFLGAGTTAGHCLPVCNASHGWAGQSSSHSRCLSASGFQSVPIYESKERSSPLGEKDEETPETLLSSFLAPLDSGGGRPEDIPKHFWHFRPQATMELPIESRAFPAFS